MMPVHVNTSLLERTAEAHISLNGLLGMQNGMIPSNLTKQGTPSEGQQKDKPIQQPLPGASHPSQSRAAGQTGCGTLIMV